MTPTASRHVATGMSDQQRRKLIEETQRAREATTPPRWRVCIEYGKRRVEYDESGPEADVRRALDKLLGPGGYKLTRVQ